MVRGWSWIVVSGLALSTVACKGDDPAAAEPDTVVLELGVEGPTIGDVLRTARRGQEPRGRTEPLGDPFGELASDRLRYRTATLGDGETLGELCQRELGTVARWQEIAELNGWTERDVNRLPAGSEVRLPIE